MLLDSAKEIEDNLKNPGTVLKIKELNKSMKILGETVKKVYPMGLPEYDPVRMELENREILAECLDAQLTKELWPEIYTFWTKFGVRCPSVVPILTRIFEGKILSLII